MAEGIIVQLEGWKRLEKKLKRMERKDARQAIRKPLRAAAKVIKGQIQANAPVITGALKRSFKVRAGKRKRGQVSIVITSSLDSLPTDTKKDYYGAAVEYGTSRIPAQPFTRQAFDTRKDEGTHIIETGIRNNIEHAARK